VTEPPGDLLARLRPETRGDLVRKAVLRLATQNYPRVAHPDSRSWGFVVEGYSLCVCVLRAHALDHVATVVYSTSPLRVTRADAESMGAQYSKNLASEHLRASL